MKHFHVSVVFATALLVLALFPAVERWREASRMTERLAGLNVAQSVAKPDVPPGDAFLVPNPDPALVVRVEETGTLLASWQTVGGCGAGSGGGSSLGLKWIGRNVTGGLFNVQEQVSYTKLGKPGYPEYNYFFNTLITADIGEKWNAGVNLPVVYKYLVDPTHIGGSGVPAVDYTNSGIGDISLVGTRKLGRINSLLLTGIIGLPTGVYDARFTPQGTPINQSQQIGFGELTGSLILDQTLDQVWGLVVVGGAAAWRGGENKVHNYRAPSGTVYGYAGYFLGPLVPAFGLSATGFTGHDRDQDAAQTTPLFDVAGNFSLEWSTDWIALLVAASVPYGYDGVDKDENGQPRSTWRLQPWTVSLGVALAPF
jgi:hypothetical protein